MGLHCCDINDKEFGRKQVKPVELQSLENPLVIQSNLAGPATSLAASMKPVNPSTVN